MITSTLEVMKECTWILEKLERNDLKTNLHLLFKAAATAKLRVKVE